MIFMVCIGLGINMDDKNIDIAHKANIMDNISCIIFILIPPFLYLGNHVILKICATDTFYGFFHVSRREWLYVSKTVRTPNPNAHCSMTYICGVFY